MYRINTKSQYDEAVRVIEETKVRYVVWNTVLGEEKVHEAFPAYRHPRPEELIMEPYLARHYDVKWSLTHVRILERKPAGEIQPSTGASPSAAEKGKAKT